MDIFPRNLKLALIVDIAEHLCTFSFTGYRESYCKNLFEMKIMQDILDILEHLVDMT